MVYNTEDGVSLQKLPDKSQISEKGQSILLLETRKKDSKTLKTRETTRVDQPDLCTITAGRARAVKEMLMRKLTKNYTYLETLV